MNFFEIEEKEKEITEKIIKEYNKTNEKDFYIEIDISTTINRYNLHGFLDNTLIEVDEFYFCGIAFHLLGDAPDWYVSLLER